MKPYILTIKNSTRLKNGRLETYPSCLPTPEIFYGVTPATEKKPDWYKVNIPKLKDHSAGIWCCLKSKLNLFKYHKEHYPDEDLMLIEDDAVFNSNFNNYYTIFMNIVPKDWDMIFLGGNHYKPPYECRPGVLRCRLVYCDECVIIRSSYIQTVIDALEHGPNIKTSPSDVIIARLMKHCHTYAPLYPFVRQVVGRSYIRNNTRNPNRKTQKYIDLNGNKAETTHKILKRYTEQGLGDYSLIIPDNFKDISVDKNDCIGIFIDAIDRTPIMYYIGLKNIAKGYNKKVKLFIVNNNTQISNMFPDAEIVRASNSVNTFKELLSCSIKMLSYSQFSKYAGYMDNTNTFCPEDIKDKDIKWIPVRVI